MTAFLFWGGLVSAGWVWLAVHDRHSRPLWYSDRRYARKHRARVGRESDGAE